MLQERLKKDTRTDHDILEKGMFVHSIMNGTLSLQQYKQLLTTNYLIHAAFEEFLFNALPHQAAGELQITRRRKVPALERDLQELEMNIPPPMQPGWVNNFPDNETSVLGAIYVLEGATLGGHVIVKNLAINPILNQLNLGFHYYRVYGDNLVPNWRIFCDVLNSQPEPAYPLIVAGAHWMFDCITSLQYGHRLSTA